MAHNINSLQTHRALQSMGSNLKTARLKRRISLEDFATRIGVSRGTVIRLEKGEAGVSIGTLAMACLVLGEIDRINNFLEASSDETGLLLDKKKLPKRIDGPRKSKKPSKQNAAHKERSEDDSGVGF